MDFWAHEPRDRNKDALLPHPQTQFLEDLNWLHMGHMLILCPMALNRAMENQDRPDWVCAHCLGREWKTGLAVPSEPHTRSLAAPWKWVEHLSICILRVSWCEANYTCLVFTVLKRNAALWLLQHHQELDMSWVPQFSSQEQFHLFLLLFRYFICMV